MSTQQTRIIQIIPAHGWSASYVVDVDPIREHVLSLAAWALVRDADGKLKVEGMVPITGEREPVLVSECESDDMEFIGYNAPLDTIGEGSKKDVQLTLDVSGLSGTQVGLVLELIQLFKWANRAAPDQDVQLDARMVDGIQVLLRELGYALCRTDLDTEECLKFISAMNEFRAYLVRHIAFLNAID